jgi:hypothetical protein
MRASSDGRPLLLVAPFPVVEGIARIQEPSRPVSSLRPFFPSLAISRRSRNSYPFGSSTWRAACEEVVTTSPLSAGRTGPRTDARRSSAAWVDT